MAGDEEQAVPLLTESDLRDPYSLRVSFVFAEAPGRMGTDDFQQLVRHTVRSETPAHLVSHVHWLAPSEFAEFRAAHDRWRQTYRRSLATRLGLDLGGED